MKNFNYKVGELYEYNFTSLAGTKEVGISKIVSIYNTFDNKYICMKLESKYIIIFNN